MEGFIIWNVIGCGVCAWHLGRLFLGNNEPKIGDTIFGICMIPMWPILIWFILGDRL